MAEHNVFLSWSGELSREIAKALREWLPHLINAVRPWMSSEDIRKGTRWNDVINSELSGAKFCIICLTMENVDAPWILFESGAISKTLEGSYVCPYLIGMKSSDVPQGPLTQFQATLATQEDTLRLVLTLNAALGNQRTDVDLEKAFSKWWPDLERDLATIIATKSSPVNTRVQRTSEDMLDEILDTVRLIALQGQHIINNATEVKAGTMIIHPKYGRGTVMRRDGKGAEAKLLIDFPESGLKKILERFAGTPVSQTEPRS